MSNYTIIPVTRKLPARAHHDVTYGFSAKTGDLTIVLSPGFIVKYPQFAIGAKVVIGYDAESKGLLIEPSASADDVAGRRTIRARAGFAGAGVILVSAQNLPEDLPRTEKRTAVVLCDVVEDAVVLDLSEL